MRTIWRYTQTWRLACLIVASLWFLGSVAQRFATNEQETQSPAEYAIHTALFMIAILLSAYDEAIRKRTRDRMECFVTTLLFVAERESDPTHKLQLEASAAGLRAFMQTDDAHPFTTDDFPTPTRGPGREES